MTPESKERLTLAKKLLTYLGIGKVDGDQIIIDDIEDPAMPKTVEELTKSLETLTTTVEDITKERDAAIELDTFTEDLAKAATAADVDALVAKVKTKHERTVTKIQARATARKTELAKNQDSEKLVKFRGTLPEAVAKVFDGLSAADQAEFMKSYKTESGDTGALATMSKALETATANSTALEKRVAKFEADKLLEDTIDEFQKDLGSLGAAGLRTFAQTVIKLRETDKSAADALIEQTKSLAKQAEASTVFGRFGKSHQGGASDAENALDKAVAKYREAHPGVTAEVAMTKVLEAQPELYGAMESEREAAH